MTEESRIIATLSELEERHMSEIDAAYHPMHPLPPKPKIDFENLAAVRERADAWLIEHPVDPPSPPIRSYLIDGATPKNARTQTKAGDSRHDAHCRLTTDEIRGDE